LAEDAEEETFALAEGREEDEEVGPRDLSLAWRDFECATSVE